MEHAALIAPIKQYDKGMLYTAEDCIIYICSDRETESIKSHETSHASTHHWTNYTHEPTVTGTHFIASTCGSEQIIPTY